MLCRLLSVSIVMATLLLAAGFATWAEASRFRPVIMAGKVRARRLTESPRRTGSFIGGGPPASYGRRSPPDAQLSEGQAGTLSWAGCGCAIVRALLTPFPEGWRPAGQSALFQMPAAHAENVARGTPRSLRLLCPNLRCHRFGCRAR